MMNLRGGRRVATASDRDGIQLGAALNRVFLIRMQGLEEIHHSERDEYTER